MLASLAVMGHWWLNPPPMTSDLATYHFLKTTSNEPPRLLLVIPSEAEGSRRFGLASPKGRDLLREPSVTRLRIAPLGMTS